MPDYKETYNAVMSLPCVQRIVRKNDKLRKENKSLRNLIQSLPEFRNQSACCCSSNRCYTDDTAVPIKIEKTTNTEIKHVNLPVESLDCDSDIEIVVPTADFKENIVYDIIEESSVTTTEEEEEEDKNAFECDDCNSKGTDCYEQLGLTKEESLIYMDLGEPDRCEDCFDKWKNSDDATATEYLKQYEEVEVEESAEEEEVEVEEEEEEVEVEESAEEEEVEVEEEEEEVEVEESAEEEEEEVEESAEEEEEEVEESAEEEEEEVEESAEEEEEEVEESAEEEELEVFEITINGTEYYTTNENDGVIYAVDADGEVGDEIGKFVNKKPVFA
jgi:flagellar biosynthesis GTPase FlhF